VVSSGPVIPPAAPVTAAPRDSLAPKSPTIAPDNHCFVELGTFINAGWMTADTWEAAGFNPLVGIGYHNTVADKTAVTFGAYFTTVSHMKAVTKVVKSTRVKFGEESDVTAITPESAQYFMLPVRIQYRPSAKQAFTAGYSIFYLLNVQSRVDTYTERLGRRDNSASYTTGGYVEGFSMYNHQLSLGYRRQLKGKLWLDTEAAFGLSDLRQDGFFGIQQFERTMGLKIGLTYDLTKK
jgi:hypothetical protein